MAKIKFNGVKGKLVIILSLFSILIVFIVGFVSYFLSKNAIEEQTFSQLTSVRETKKRAIENYFQQIANQSVTLSQDLTIIQSAEVFTHEFEVLDTLYNEDEIAEYRKNIKSFYNNSFLPKLNSNLIEPKTVDQFLPKKNAATVLQNFYISENHYPLGQKNNLNKALDGSKYSEWHETVHPIINDYLQKFGFYDIFIVNTKGDIVYSVFKEIDFATNLLNGPHDNSNFAKAYQKALNLSKSDSYVIEDFEFYDPSYHAPASFIASPIFKENNKIGVLVMQMPVDYINASMTGNNSWEKDGLGKTGETYLIGSDYLMRSNSRFLIEDKRGYLNLLQNLNVKENTVNLISNLNTSILLADVQSDVAHKVVSGQSGTEITKDYRQENVLSSYTPLNIEGLEWYIISEIDSSEAFEPIYKIRLFVIIIGLILLFVSIILANTIANVFTKSILILKSTFENLAKGFLQKPEIKITKDEIGDSVISLNQMIDNLHDASNFAIEIGDGKFNNSFQPKGENDTLGNALIQMRDKLAFVANEDKKRSWAIQGMALFSEILRRNNDNIKLLSEELIIELINYIKANQGAIFIVQEDYNGTFLKLTGCYAYERKKYLDLKIEQGEGLTGQCWLEGKTIYLTDIPDNYVNITSGLGKANPRAIIIVPLKINDEIMGVMEMASFTTLEDYEIDFLEKIAESIASTLKSVKVNMKTAALLLESKEQSEVLKQQEEEMRQNIEEMQATQEMYEDKEEGYKREIEMLRNRINELESQ
jgi:HAMP domain-containing protein